MDWEEEAIEGNEDVEEQALPELFYSNVAEFVAEQLAPVYRRDVDLAGRSTTFTWCAQWWRHDEAVSRLSGLWRAWENLRTDPTTGLAVWWRDYADPTMRVLFDEKGPFHGCTPRAHNPKGISLPLNPPPEGLFD
ncbi:DUF4913 domain-containing protein [Kocuria sp. cx-116]|uniref:DUF4913 domain-containing protein n=1 Tax=Kocuria sp. cx-116 TaxID=2771378 RepID=UPI0016826809|nr:DUF4913 domain-containing protein [Kocuria sp. cx-116]MBD2763586.1 DUF4913 domain-containing protein [Kocuria sp. cx-116]